ncbi:molybdopterin-dependent oxidoreductase [Breoghania sp.]|uniref:molybdopterin-dependent oxidoreductase n=1 Tax=Breoghania sp. TaxID=2065378 RepID=UPI002AA8587D|nr:molybdopterin-dependent oxidoreductase [Breoghania sp.]
MLNRRQFVNLMASGAISATMLPHLARAASGVGGVTDGRVLANTCLGPLWLIKKDGQVVGVEMLEQLGYPDPLLRAMPDRLYARDRVRAPMVRASFLKDREKADRTLRGSRDFVEVSWDDALKLVADEITRVKETHGNASLHRGKSSWASNHAKVHRTEAMNQRFLNLIGGASTFFGNYSNQAVNEIITGVGWGATGMYSDFPGLLKNTELMVIWGANPMVTTRILSARKSTRYWFDLKDSDIETVVIDPVRSETVQHLGSQWMPVASNTDVALALGIMHTLLVEDIYDKEFVSTHAFGFDDFAAYLKGAEDGTEKTAEWAAEITGLAAEDIKALARKMVAKRTYIAGGWSIQRQHHGEQTPWALMALGCMIGQIGLPGGGVSFGMHYADGGYPKPDMPVLGGMSPGKNPVEGTFPIAAFADAFLNPGKELPYKDKSFTLPDVRLVYTSGGNQFTHHQDTNRLIEAFQQPETVIVQEPWWTPTAFFADIVLPASSDLERNDLGQVANLILAAKQVVAPQHKSRPDYEIFSELADRFGVRDAYTDGGKTDIDWAKQFYEDARGRSTSVEMPPFEEFWAGDGIIEFPEGKGDKVMLAEYREDPLLNPLGTSTGLIEITSPYIAKMNIPDCPAHPTWMEPVEWRKSEEAKDYPLHLVSAHSPHRLHSQMDNTIEGESYKVNGREPMTINSADAKARGLKTGDVARIFNARGQVLAAVVVSDDISAGNVLLHEGAWYDPQEPGVIGTLDKEGSANTLTRDLPLSSGYGQATIAETAIVQVEKFEGEVPDVTAYVGL